MKHKSYSGKTFIVENSKTVIRSDDLAPVKYQPGDTLPPGAKVGDVKIIPKRTEIVVKDVKPDPDRRVFVLARAANDPAVVFGWTSAANLLGSFTNETIGLAPAKWSLEPQGTNKTCIDAHALIREGPPGFASTGRAIPQKSFVVVTDSSGDNVKVSNLDIVGGSMAPGEELGWTRRSNLADGCSDLYFSAEWLDHKGPNACWEHGSYIGPKLLVNIVGFGAELEQVTFDSLDAYLELKDAAAQDHIEISINSAFRTFQRQAELRHLFEIHQGNNAAPAGASNHQHGQAFDLNTGHNILDGSDEVYEWLKQNATKHGFVRAVSGESWHWEYRPEEAAELAAQGKFMTPGVHD
jgi:hypothetical protein